MVINMLKKIIITLIPLTISLILGLFIESNLNGLVLPPYMPPSYVFGIVWTILYLLMGYSLNLVLEDNKAVYLFIIQLFFNYSWTYIFFSLRNFEASLIWIMILIFTLMLMLIRFFIVNKKASYLNFPYFIWLLIALYLTSGILVLN